MFKCTTLTNTEQLSALVKHVLKKYIRRNENEKK